LHTQVTHGELTEAPLETLSAVAQHVFLPLLTTSSNQEGWPDVVAKEVSENLHRFVANGEQNN
jgi:dynein heavy chain